MEAAVRILLAEDEPLIAMSIQEALEEGGFAVHAFASGSEAITALETDDPPPHGLITDVRLGSGPDGWEVARRARELYAAIPVVYMSGDSALDHTSQGVPDSLMVQKPFAAAQIVTAISTLLNQVPPITQP
jgi:two-component system cell cycle response regulator CpdR